MKKFIRSIYIHIIYILEAIYEATALIETTDFAVDQFLSRVSYLSATNELWNKVTVAVDDDDGTEESRSSQQSQPSYSSPFSNSMSLSPPLRSVSPDMPNLDPDWEPQSRCQLPNRSLGRTLRKGVSASASTGIGVASTSASVPAPRNTQMQNDDDYDDDMCILCCDLPASAKFMPCGHMVACDKCADDHLKYGITTQFKV